MIGLCRHPDPFIRAEAARSLEMMGKKAHTAVPSLLRLTQDGNRRVTRCASRALSAMGKRVVPLVTRAILDTRYKGKKPFIHVLLLMRKEHKEIFKLLPELLLKGDDRVREEAVLGILNLYEETFTAEEKPEVALDRRHMPALVRILGRSSSRAKIAALGIMENAARHSLAWLSNIIKALDDVVQRDRDLRSPCRQCSSASFWASEEKRPQDHRVRPPWLRWAPGRASTIGR